MQPKQIAIALAVALSAPVFAGGGPQHSQRPQDAMSDSSQRDSARGAGASNTSSLVRDAQDALQKKGYDVGQIDGVMGPKTSAALREFQQAQGLSASGSLDQQTLSALDVQSDARSGNRVAPDAKSGGTTSSSGTTGADTSGTAQGGTNRGSTSSDTSPRAPDATTSSDRMPPQPDPTSSRTGPRSGG